MSIGSDSIQNFNALKQYFNSIKEHDSYIIREKLYNMDDTGMKQAHIKFEHALETLQNIDHETIDYYFEDLNKIKDEIEETLVIITHYDQFNLDIEDLRNYALLIGSGVNHFTQLLDKIEDQTSEEINELLETTQTEEELLIRYKYQDNIDQLLKSFTWKEFENYMINTDDGAEFEIFVQLLMELNEIKLKGSLLENIDYINQLSNLSLYIRQQAAIDMSRIFVLSPLFLAIVRLFAIETGDIPISNSRSISKQRLYDDLAHIMDSGRTSLLSLMIEQVLLDTPKSEKGNIHLKFAELFFKLSRDPKELFLWTMKHMSQKMADDQIIDLSYKVANLSGMLLTCTIPLQQCNANYLVEEIKEMEDISYLDAISDLSEIYNPSNASVEHMKKALIVKIQQLKELLIQTIKYDEILKYVIMLFEIDPVVTQEVTLENLRTIIDNY